jgi:hypothetical protein
MTIIRKYRIDMTQAAETIRTSLVVDGLGYSEFMDALRTRIDKTDTTVLDEQELALHEYTVLNLRRSERIERTWIMPDELREAAKGLDFDQTWMVLTEGWCGDSAQNLPYLAAVAALNPRIDFRILERDDHLDVMDMYLTNETRSIPKLVIFDRDGQERAVWGPRPAPAAKLVQDLKSQGLPRAELYERLHLWYGRDRGKEISKELLTLLRGMK